MHPKLVRAVRTRTTVRWASRLSMLIALVLACGCASLKPPNSPPEYEKPSACSRDAAGWWALGWVLEVIGPILADH